MVNRNCIVAFTSLFLVEDYYLHYNKSRMIFKVPNCLSFHSARCQLSAAVKMVCSKTWLLLKWSIRSEILIVIDGTKVHFLFVFVILYLHGSSFAMLNIKCNIYIMLYFEL